MSGTGANSLELPIYLDNQSTTRTDPRVVEAMLPYFTEIFGNPHSEQHAHGRAAMAAVDEARGRVAAIIGAEPREIVFTSGATESNNIAIKGAGHFHAGRKRHVVTCATEHKCVLESCKRLESEGFRLTVLGVGEDGLIDLEALAEAIGDDTVLVSIMAVNNEIGVIQPIAEIGRLCRERGVYYHCDAAQAVGKIPMDVEAMNIDLLSISGHKAYGPKGVGALYVRRRPRVRLEPLFDGGGQERGVRSGTLPAPLCVGLGVACDIARSEMADESARLTALRERLLSGLRDGLGDVRLNGHPDRRVAGNLNVSFPGVALDALFEELADLSFSSGSACTSAAVEPSYVLRALGLPDALAASSIRIGLGRFTTEAEVDYALERLVSTVRSLSKSPRPEAAE
jgi:cysteine desulfurase